MPAFDETLMSRVEDAGLNASAPPQQRWLDGWLVRYLPGKARRARCINAVAAGRLPLPDKLALAAQIYRDAGLPMIFRVTRFTQPAGLDAELAALGYGLVDHTQVMICSRLPARASLALPAGMHWGKLDGAAFSQTVGALRGSPPEHCASHALRLQHSPVPYEGYAIRSALDGTVLACGQFAREADLVGLYDVHTHASVRSHGLAGLICERILTLSAQQGANIAYLQVDAQNEPALKVYRRLGFESAYGYHYRERIEA